MYDTVYLRERARAHRENNMRQNIAEAQEVENDGPVLQSANQGYFGNEPDADVQHSMKLADSDDRQFIDEINPQEVAEAAYLRWESLGCPPGTAADDWIWAKRELISQRGAADALLAARKRRNREGLKRRT
jgi:hypothetical protein